MKDKDKTKEQLIKELAELRQRIAELEASETERLSAARLPDGQEQAGKRAEEALKEYSERLEEMVESSAPKSSDVECTEGSERA